MPEQEKDKAVTDLAQINHRKVRSFVRREGRLTPKQAWALDELWANYGIDYSAQLLDLGLLFTKKQPIVLEIGFGMGESLLTTAVQHPDINYLGIEVHRPGVGNLLNKIHVLALTNVKLISYDAVEVLKHMIPVASLAKVQIFFPDPWPKKKHHKRRLIQPAFIELLSKKLMPNGILHLATDWQPYAEHMLDVLENSSQLGNQAEQQHYVPRPDDRPLTKYEQRGQRLGHGVWDLMFIKS